MAAIYLGHGSTQCDTDCIPDQGNRVPNTGSSGRGTRRAHENQATPYLDTYLVYI